MSYKLLIERRVRKFLMNLKREKKLYIQIAERIFDLSVNPYPQDAKKIKGEKKFFFKGRLGRISNRLSSEGRRQNGFYNFDRETQ